ncbi:unnamed protein product [Clonostachys rosea f. rosea IK726]|uniref:Uncharacterized protein n=1 Tax=Clonostachys rosea f. rosea IK726 TaxID=1349383 RepID=A0ACA9UHK8_BIOOC|nr:unnamed protein product [Clonostachys rosea f. rosea IK726]
MSHRLSRRHSTSFEDQLLELVDDLDDDQVYELLQDLNNTVESNVAVSHGIDLFEHAKHKPINPPAAPPARQTSIRRSAFGLPKLFRSASKRISSAQAPNPRLKTGAPSARRHYRKISRPTLSSYGSVPDLNGALLSAYLARNPSQCDHTTSPPILETPSPESASARLDVQDPGMDILAPFVFGGSSREGEKIGSISEVLGF